MEEIKGIYGTDNIAVMQTMFQNCKNLTKIESSINCSSLTNSIAMFNGNFVLQEIPELIGLGDSTLSDAYAMFANCREVTSIPLFDTSHIKNLQQLCWQCYKLESIPDYDFSSVTNVQGLFKDCYNVSEGILETYDKLLARGDAITNHTDCFLNCGQDTPEGQAALAQIPTSWGGLKEE